MIAACAARSLDAVNPLFAAAAAACAACLAASLDSLERKLALPQTMAERMRGASLRQRELALQALEAGRETRRAGRPGRLGARRTRDGDAVPA